MFDHHHPITNQITHVPFGEFVPINFVVSVPDSYRISLSILTEVFQQPSG
ncbi:MAG: hypothetical protein AB7H80_03720 [Candidatus Kapaibacterium sp.]